VTAVLEVDHVTVAFGGVNALDDVELSVGEAEIHGVIGPNGAGKTTLLNVICGLARSTSGRVRLMGADITGWKPSDIARQGLGRTFQTSQLFQGMTVLENLVCGLHRRTKTGLLAAALRTKAAREEEEQTVEAARKALEFVGMERFRDRPATMLSFGQQRVVEIARTLMPEPAIVLLDEPAVGLSLNRIEELDLLLRRIRDERGVTLIMIEHVIRLVMGVCDRVTVLSGGTRIAEGVPDQVREDPAVVTAYLGKELHARSDRA
jgi:branched-chain amino acid transport system ATP-binding protein